MDTQIICPLGCECEKAVKGHVERCAWYTDIIGVNPQTGEEMNESKCAMSLMPVMMIEQARQMRSTAAALESHRNVVKATGDAMMQIERERPLKAVGD